MTKERESALPVLSPADFEIGDILGCPPVIENAQDRMLLVLVPEGDFIAGDNILAINGKGEREFKASLAAYYLAIHPVTNMQYMEFLKSTRQFYRSPYHRASYLQATWMGPESFQAKIANHPVVNVCWDDAQAYCSWAGLRLPSELEWEKGARGVDGRRYPWGNHWDQDCVRCARSRWGETTCEVWKEAKGQSPWGLYQMTGNVWEWCADWYDEDGYSRYKAGDLTPPAEGERRVVRGGSFYSEGTCVAERSVSAKPSDCRNDIGFRCARTL